MSRRGLRVRLSRIPGETAKGVLRSPVYLPVVLGPFTVSEEASHFEYDTHRAGQFSVPAQGPKTARSLRDLGLDTLTLDWQASWLDYTDPRRFMNAVNDVLRARSPVLLLATLQFGDPEEFRAPVTLRRTTRELRPGEADTRYWTLEVREWRNASLSRRTADPKNDRLPARHHLTATDTWSSLAQKYHHTSMTWRVIAKKNGLPQWGARTPIVNSTKFKVGDIVTIPKAPPQIADPGGTMAGHRR
jgi:hypothetical protein